MPVGFLSEAQRQRYGRFIGEPTPEQLARSFYFDDNDVELISQHRGEHNRLGFALQLGTVRFLGTFLSNPIDVPPGVISYISQQIDTTQTACLSRYIERKQTYHAHRIEIQKTYQYWEFHEQWWRFRLSRWLYIRVWLSNERPSYLFDLAVHWLTQRKVLLPGITTLTRLVAQIRERAALRAWKRLACLPNQEQSDQLEALLNVPEGKRTSQFDQLRQGPRRVSSTAMIAALDRHKTLRDLGIRELDFSRVPQVWLKNLARYAAMGWAPNIARMPQDRRTATLVSVQKLLPDLGTIPLRITTENGKLKMDEPLVAFAYAYTVETLDDALDLFDMLISDIAATAKTLGQKKRLRSLRDLDHSAISLAQACSILIDETLKISRPTFYRYLALPDTTDA